MERQKLIGNSEAKKRVSAREKHVWKRDFEEGTLSLCIGEQGLPSTAGSGSGSFR